MNENDPASGRGWVVLGTAANTRDRADEIRALVDWMRDSETQAIIFRFASDYELLAVRAAGQTRENDDVTAERPGLSFK
jgi:hypothetical protein